MQSYRLYTTGAQGRINAPPRDEWFASDEACRTGIAGLATEMAGVEA